MQTTAIELESGAMRSSRVAALFPMPVAAAEMGDAVQVPLVLAEERQYLRCALPGRRRDFAAGRACARHAVAMLGSGGTIGRHGDGGPRWPEGIMGSISHTEGLCAAVACRIGKHIGLGLDVERLSPLDDEVLDEYCTAPERSFLDALPARNSQVMAIALFSAKEALYKCQHPLTGRWLEFRDVTLRLRTGGGIELAGWPAAVADLHFAGRYRIEDEHVMTGFWAWRS